MSSFTEEQKREIKDIMHEALGEFFLGYGRIGKSYLIGTAIVVGSLVTIFGGLKLFLGWIGFSYLGK